MRIQLFATVTLAIGALTAADTAAADPTQIARGKYLVQIAGCGDCHTPGYFLGKVDPARELSGSDVGFHIPGVGTVVGPNLTPDKNTGLGNWTAKQIVTALTSGALPDGRILSPVMPWARYSQLDHADAEAIAAYLKSLAPVRHYVTGPLPANVKPTMTTFTLTPLESTPRAPADSKR